MPNRRATDMPEGFTPEAAATPEGFVPDAPNTAENRAAGYGSEEARALVAQNMPWIDSAATGAPATAAMPEGFEPDGFVADLPADHSALSDSLAQASAAMPSWEPSAPNMEVGQFAPTLPTLSTGATGASFPPPAGTGTPGVSVSQLQSLPPSAGNLMSGATAKQPGEFTPPTDARVAELTHAAEPIFPGLTPGQMGSVAPPAPPEPGVNTFLGRMPSDMDPQSLLQGSPATEKEIEAKLFSMGEKRFDYTKAEWKGGQPTRAEAIAELQKEKRNEFLSTALMGLMPMSGLGAGFEKFAPKAQAILRDLIPQAMRDKTLSVVELAAREDLQSLGLSKKAAQAALDQSKTQTVISAVQQSKKFFGARGVDPAARASLAKDSAAIIESLNVPKGDAVAVLKWMVKQPYEPLPEITALAKGMERGGFTLNPGSADAPIQLNRNASKLMKENTWGIWHALHPESVMSLDPATNQVFKTARVTEDNIRKTFGKFAQKALDTLKPFNAPQQNIIRMALNGDLPPIAGRAVPLPPKLVVAINTLRNEVLNPLARFKYANPATGKLESLPEQGRMLKDYFPHFFDAESGAPLDVVLRKAEMMSGKKWDALADAEKGKFLRLARAVLAKEGLPSSYYYGNISKHRETIGDSRTAKTIKEQLLAYIGGAVRKSHMDAFYKEVDPLLGRIPTESIELRAYAQQYLDDFRGVPRGKGRALGDTLRTVQAVAKLGLNATSAALNLTQTSINTYSVVGSDTLLQAIKLRHTPAGHNLLAESGVFQDLAKHELMPSQLPKTVSRISDELLRLFGKSESYNREVAYLSGYLKQYIATPRASTAALQHAGRELVDRTQFIFSQSGRPAFYGTPLGATMGQFKLFGLNQLKFIKSLKKEEAVRFVLSTALHGGMNAVPGSASIPQALFGVQTIQSVKERNFPAMVENMILGGLPRAMGITIEGEVGVGFLPDLTQLSQVAPVAASLPISVAKNFSAFKGDSTAREKLSSELIRTGPAGVAFERGRQAYLVHKRGGLVLGPSGELQTTMSNPEQLFAAIAGGRTTKLAKERERADFIFNLDQQVQFDAGRFYHDARIAIANGDNAGFIKSLENAEKDGVLDVIRLDKGMFEPRIMKRFAALPRSKQANVLANNPQFREEYINKELQALGMFLSKMGELGRKKE